MKLDWNSLTREEQQAVQRMARGTYLMLTVQMADRLKEIGWAEERLGGTGLSKAGKEAYAAQIMRARRLHGNV